MTTQKNRIRVSCLVLLSLGLSVSMATYQQAEAQKKRPKRKPNPAFAKIKEDPGLPRVLLIGDSISIGYTLAVREMLKDKANVHRIPTNGGPTTRGVAQIDNWLGTGKWDVIHFNWGLHDLKYIDGQKQVALADYESNLRQLVKRMKQTGATLIWCSTTPVPEGPLQPPRKFTEVVEYNKIARKVADDFDLQIDDLYSYALPRLKEIQRQNNVHFTPEGSRVLAKQVSKSILESLKKK